MFLGFISGLILLSIVSQAILACLNHVCSLSQWLSDRVAWSSLLSSYYFLQKLFITWWLLLNSVFLIFLDAMLLGGGDDIVWELLSYNLIKMCSCRCLIHPCWISSSSVYLLFLRLLKWFRELRVDIIGWCSMFLDIWWVS